MFSHHFAHPSFFSHSGKHLKEAKKNFYCKLGNFSPRSLPFLSAFSDVIHQNVQKNREVWRQEPSLLLLFFLTYRPLRMTNILCILILVSGKYCNRLLSRHLLANDIATVVCLQKAAPLWCNWKTPRMRPVRPRVHSMLYSYIEQV